LGQFGGYRVTDYCATKFAVTGFTEALRIELKSLNNLSENNVKVSLVSSYHIDNDFFKGFEMESFKWAKVQKNDPQELVKTITNGIRLDKELIGFPSVQFYLFLAIKK
jgi:short-subunit dehydrogenase